ncbi:MAG: hypothetical protein N4A59_06215 [Marinifilum sp.]|jgi:hypothetical protein|nr:hypothetical protein [Marinifilum sp.]
MEINWGNVQEKYHTVLQTQAYLADTKNMIGELGRGSGKTTHTFAPRIVRISYDLAGSIMMLAGPTYTFLLETIVPEIVTYLNTHYTRGIHFEYGRRPPKHFKQPYTEILRWEHTISFGWGTVIQFGSMDRPESFVGKNIVHLFIDEMLRIKEGDFRERAIPALRADKSLFGHSPYFKGITGFSSTPNMETDHDWWQEFESNVNPEVIKEVQYVAYRIGVAGGIIAKLKEEIKFFAEKGGCSKKIETRQKKIKYYQRFMERWSRKLRARRKEKDAWWCYLKASSFSNLAFLGLDYMEQQLMSSGDNWEKFNLSILGIRPKTVKNKFFAKFSEKHIFTDSYQYDYESPVRGELVKSIDDHSIADKYEKCSLDLAYCDKFKPLLMGYDPGYFMSAVFAQKKREFGGEELRIFKDFHVITPDQHREMAVQIDDFFKGHCNKTIYMYPDRAGHQHSPRHRNNPKGKTDIAILRRELEELGWIVHIEGITRTIEYWEHFFLWDRLLSERERKLPKLRFCQYEAECCVSSIQMSPAKKRDDGMIELDKTAEKKLDYSDQAMYSPQIATAATYLVFGLYHDLTPEADWDSVDIEGL